MKTVFLASLLVGFTVSSTAPGLAYLDDYTPLSKADKQRKIRLNTVSDAGLKEGKTIKIASAEMRMPAEGDNLVFSGKDKNGKPWTFTKRYYGMGTAFYTKDLDCNGTTDIILLQSTGACGIAPPTVLTFLLFDKNLRPFPMEEPGYSVTDPDSFSAKSKFGYIDDLITLGTSKHAVLVCFELDSANLKKDKWGSFWRISMYQANNGRWDEIKKYKGYKVPMIVRYTFKPNHKVIPNPVPSLRTYENGAFGPAEEKLCKTGTVTKIELEDGKVKTVTIKPDLKFDISNWARFSTYFIHETKNKYELLAMESDEAEAQMKTFADKKVRVRYSKPTVPQKPPQYIWLIDD